MAAFANPTPHGCVKQETKRTKMKIRTSLLLFTCIVLGSSCQEEADKIPETSFGQAIAGSWVLVEYGYSPGAGYITEVVPEIPRQTIDFQEDFGVSTNIERLMEYKFYRILEDTASESMVIALYEENPGSAVQDISKLAHSYSVQWNEGKLILYYRWCIEGCHLGFKRITEVD